MDELALQMQDYIGRLAANPRIELPYRESSYYPYDAEWFADSAAYFEKDASNGQAVPGRVHPEADTFDAS